MSMAGVININFRKALDKKDKNKLKEIFKEYSNDEILEIDKNMRVLYVKVNSRHSYDSFKILMENNILSDIKEEKHLIIENLINDKCRKQAVYLFKNHPELSVLMFDKHWTSNALFGASVKFDFTKEKNKELLSYILKQIPLDITDKQNDNVITYLCKNIKERMENIPQYAYNDQPIKDIEMMFNNLYFFAVNKDLGLNHIKDGVPIKEMLESIETKKLSGQKDQEELRVKFEKMKSIIYVDYEKNKILKVLNKDIKKAENKKRL